MHTKLILITIFLIICMQANAENLWDKKASYWFTDSKARKIGDNVTVIISESSSAYHDADTKFDNKSDLSAGPGVGGLLESGMLWQANTFTEADKFAGKGATKRTGKISASITARIIQLIDTGTYKIKGIKEIEVNCEKQVIDIEGIIRAEDIGENNTILSTYISDAKIKVTGTGTIGDSQDPGVISKVFAWLF